jgi:ABC-2 type transport system permease protein
VAMSKTGLIIKHEFITSIRRTGFIIMTLIVPVIGLLAIAAVIFISGSIKPGPVELLKIGYVDKPGGFEQYTAQRSITLVPYATETEANRALVSGEIKEYFVIPADYVAKGVVNRYTLQKQLQAPPATAAAIQTFLESNLLAGKVTQETIDRVEAPLNLASTRLTPTGEVAPEQGGYGNVIIPGVFSLLLVLSITFSSGYLLQGLGEEKESRLIEVLLSSVSSRQLMMGKVFGIGAAGLLQVAVWVISLPLLLGLASSTFGGFIASVQLPAGFLVLGIVYFILGYLLFAVIATGIGAISPTAREGQQLSTLFILTAVSPLWFSSLLLLFPDATPWVVLTIFPFTAPVVVMLRLGATVVPAWQLAASLAVLAAFIAGGLWLTVKIVRSYLLMYGKRPGLGAIIRTLRA